MGHANGLTREVERAIGEADILLGAERMLKTACSKAEKHPFYQAEQIIPHLYDIQSENLFGENKKIVILFSGDSGFYSGCQSLYAALEKEISEGRLKASLRILPGISDDIQVYAVEQNHEAVSLIEQNKRQFELQNVTVVESRAPEGLAGLPMATHAFIGGSGGRLKEILVSLRRMNPKMRVVISAVSMETICEMREILTMNDMIKEEEIIQLQVSRAKKAGSHHLMQSENPVWICAFEFCDEIF